jgi:hypothetical protein
MARSIIPWFILNLQSKELIVLPNVPVDVKSTKETRFTQTPMPGGSTDMVQFSGLGANKLSFEIKLLKKNNVLGNMPTLKQFENLRVPVFSVFDAFSAPVSNQPPKIIYWYGSGMSLPQQYYVTKLDFSHKYYNTLGFPQMTDIQMELTLDEYFLTYKFEKYSRAVLSTLGTIESVVTLFKYWIGGRSPYNLNTFKVLANVKGSGFTPG